jgi:hypothetical protein
MIDAGSSSHELRVRSKLKRRPTSSRRLSGPAPTPPNIIGGFTSCLPCALSQTKLKSLSGGHPARPIVMNGANSNNHPPAHMSMNPGTGSRVPRPPPPGPAPPAPAPPSNNFTPTNNYTHPHPHPHPHAHPYSHTHPHAHPPSRVNGTSSGGGQKGKKKNDTPVDPATMYESLKSRIAALEEEEVLEEEEERKFGE